ncbi:GAF domain-containing protein [Plebeiibacterium marinum]|uniref:GAF domain-containing protein n=1 Tax=Plebeiibacterium marinum TaxID=2992111 RepID=A0AAE3SID7_9BACT|nr:GAF domain-containing protein [Plebeiobacterium marinum]MCW3804605.1 GAF domain-containing protein [Plebeiobacterium marinum]
MGVENINNIKCAFCDVPFKVSLSFEYLIESIKQISGEAGHPMQSMATETLDMLAGHPELCSRIDDKEILEENSELVRKLMAFLINPLNDNVLMAALFPPFGMQPFYCTQMFKDVVLGESKTLEIAFDLAEDLDKMLVSLLYHAYLLILDKVYGLNLYKDKPITLKLTDENSGLVKYFTTRIDTQYVRVNPLQNHKKLSDDELKQLFDKENDLDYWNEMIPLENFEFSGLMKFDYVDSTYDYVISQLKSDLLDKNAIITLDGFANVKNRIKSLIENPFLEVGMMAIHDFESSYNRNYIWKSIIPYQELSCEDYRDTFYEKALTEKKIVITNDLAKVDKNKVVEAFLKRNIRSHVVIPLILDSEVVGMLEFACSMPESLSMIQVKRLHELFPIFALALQRSKEEWNDKVRAIIQTEFTAIHPTVEWKFQETVSNLISQEYESSESAGIEPIVFPGVVPIYGASDIRGSSVERNKGIQADLTTQLHMVKELLCCEEPLAEIPLVSNLCYKINEFLSTVEGGLKAGDEVSILDFLRNEIEPVLNIMRNRFKDMVEPIDKYFASLDPDLKVIYSKRKDFEDSLTLINDQVSDIIDKEQVKAQQVYPHYFEKYRTDGVEYNAYLGQSLVKGLPYSDIYLKNIRLWQLLVKIKVARRVRKLQPELKTKLDVTQLILVHSAPLSIAFRQDEKKFDVDGAYNIRYEITKKRIDKAMVKGTRERVTQVGRIAIIYSYAEEIEEYRRYIDFMKSRKLITDNVEDLELEDLTGASGLRALRIEVNFDDLESEPFDKIRIEEVIKG